MVVFFLSSAFHEYWFGMALKMFYPVIFILYFVFGGKQLRAFCSIKRILLIREPNRMEVWCQWFLGSTSSNRCRLTQVNMGLQLQQSQASCEGAVPSGPGEDAQPISAWPGSSFVKCSEDISGPPFFSTLFIFRLFSGVFYFATQFIKSSTVWNIAMYSNLLIGTGMFVSFYSQEWYARQRCAPYFQRPVLDFFIPQHWLCKQLIELQFMI